MTGIITGLSAQDIFVLADLPYAREFPYQIPAGFERVSLADLGITQADFASFDKITPEVYRDANNNYIVSFRGSNLPGIDEALRDTVTDHQLARGVTPEALTQACDFFRLVQQGANDISPGEVGLFAAIGHSLGGSEALYVAARMQFELGLWVEGIGIDAAYFKPDIALPETSTSYFPNSLFNISTPGGAITAVTGFQAATRGVIMPAEQIDLTPNPATQDQYGPTPEEVKAACGVVSMACLTAVLQAHDLRSMPISLNPAQS